MFLTEEEARKKWCPILKGWQGNEVTGFSYMQHCEAADCMMWRWGAEEEHIGDTIMTRTIPLRRPLGKEWTCTECGGRGKVTDDRSGREITCPECDGESRGREMVPLGYCGLSGRPGVLP